jgi:hypothetical protein
MSSEIRSAATSRDDFRRYLAKTARAADNQQCLPGKGFSATPGDISAMLGCNDGGGRANASSPPLMGACNVDLQRSKAGIGFCHRIGGAAFCVASGIAIQFETGKRRMKARARHPDNLRGRKQRLPPRQRRSIPSTQETAFSRLPRRLRRRPFDRQVGRTEGRQAGISGLRPTAPVARFGPRVFPAPTTAGSAPPRYLPRPFRIRFECPSDSEF